MKALVVRKRENYEYAESFLLAVIRPEQRKEFLAFEEKKIKEAGGKIIKTSPDDYIATITYKYSYKDIGWETYTTVYHFQEIEVGDFEPGL